MTQHGVLPRYIAVRLENVQELGLLGCDLERVGVLSAPFAYLLTLCLAASSWLTIACVSLSECDRAGSVIRPAATRMFIQQ